MLFILKEHQTIQIRSPLLEQNRNQTQTRTRRSLTYMSHSSLARSLVLWGWPQGHVTYEHLHGGRGRLSFHEGCSDSDGRIYQLKELQATLVAQNISEKDSEPSAHRTGSARTEGFYKFADMAKAIYLPHRNTAQVNTASARISSRMNRVNNRRMLVSMATDSDILKLNQLKMRKKQLRFAKSPIHDWSLFAMKKVDANDMVIEYIGEMIRQKVADHREKRYERMSIGSSYLFRVDDDTVTMRPRWATLRALSTIAARPTVTPRSSRWMAKRRLSFTLNETLKKARRSHTTTSSPLSLTRSLACAARVDVAVH
ncbi:MAG: hypothetical protein J3Q66DRAFT_162350 [Benniella sp.]|nr:MAG: hypothetical protein J3Q66DRAFT_162350 [Benniella sp.]